MTTVLEMSPTKARKRHHHKRHDYERHAHEKKCCRLSSLSDSLPTHASKDKSVFLFLLPDFSLLSFVVCKDESLISFPFTYLQINKCIKIIKNT